MWESMKCVQSDGNVVHNIFTKQIVSHNLWSGNRKAFRNIVLVVVNVLSLIQVVFMRQNYHFSFDHQSTMLLIDLLQNEKQIKPFLMWDNKIRCIRNNNWILDGHLKTIDFHGITTSNTICYMGNLKHEI